MNNIVVVVGRIDSSSVGMVTGVAVADTVADTVVDIAAVVAAVVAAVAAAVAVRKLGHFGMHSYL